MFVFGEDLEQVLIGPGLYAYKLNGRLATRQEKARLGHKINEWFRFVVDVIGVYFARETYVAHRYFLDRNNVGIIATFQKVGAGGKFPKKLLKKLDNIAWDFLIPRFMENLICKYGCADGGAKNNYIIPTFMTFDRNLKQLLSLFPIKAVVYDNVNGTLVPIPMINVESYFKGQGCSNEFDSFCNEFNNRQNESPPVF